MCILRLARAYPTVAAWLFALLFWKNSELRNALLISGLCWVPLQIGLTGMAQSIFANNLNRPQMIEAK